eukprot:CAMPEP_0119154052 /NCGR_PEP_ID=MMETSP1310-20130426/50228_1 /TAXON_ID=464262 /ORGANISM="Genus nov. species nov., Strain RCC2339" /LENGTH=546 /DNA_ID=CAMNT_0007146549 /DNA_START=31 /DNA_END=1667 /DNA_ORIENTATION=+
MFLGTVGRRGGYYGRRMGNRRRVGGVRVGDKWKHTGAASVEGTASRREKVPLGAGYRRAGKTGWSVGMVGVGTSRLSRIDSTCRQTVADALQAGCNVLHSSGNFQNGEAQSVLGEVLGETLENGDIRREEVVLVSQGGTFQGGELECLKDKLEDVRRDWQEGDDHRKNDLIIEVNPTLWCSFSPALLRQQLERSLEDLGVETLDVFLLEYPELLLSRGPNVLSSPPSSPDSLSTSSPPHHTQDRRAQVRDHLRQSFSYLESEVQRGRLQYYGVVSDTLGFPPTHAGHTHLGELLRLAEEASSSDECHFGAVLYPCNLLEGSTVTDSTQRWEGEGSQGPAMLPASEWARRADLFRLTSRSLDAYVVNEKGENDVFRLGNFSDRGETDLPGMLKEAMDYTIHLEQLYPGQKDPKLPSPATLSWGQVLAHNLHQFRSLGRWRDVLSRQILPTLYKSVIELQRDKRQIWWGSKYLKSCLSLFERISWSLEGPQNSRADAIASSIQGMHPALGGWDPAVRTAKGDPSRDLARTSLQSALLSGGDCTLLGMR